jgi:hypothetical protein
MLKLVNYDWEITNEFVIFVGEAFCEHRWLLFAANSDGRFCVMYIYCTMLE